MASKSLTVGADRFLALEWANYAYELFCSLEDQETSRKHLREYLETQMVGKVSTRKTTDQLNRLWLNSWDTLTTLREMTRSFSHSIDTAQMLVLHLGIAINVFPIYRETVRVIGTLDRITDKITSKSITSRVIEKFPTTSSIPRTVSRVLQTLTDWRFIEVIEGNAAVKELPVQDPKLVNWYILAVLKATQRNEITLSDLEICPFKLGINFAHPRRAIIDSEEMIFSRNQQGVEVIRVRD
jgi:hypothetical protein